MSIYPLFAAPTRPALAPILFPDGEHALARMVDERYDAGLLACRLAHVIPAHIIARQAAWSQRLDARIARRTV